MNALTYVHNEIERRVKPGDFVVDATCGRGFDTLFLANVVGSKGKVVAFDIQQSAIDSTALLLHEHNVNNVELVLDSHSNIKKYIHSQVDCIVFNLGYLPKGDHKVFTRAETTIPAIQNGLDLLKSGGLMCVSIYYGGDSGYEEKDQLMSWLKTLDDSKYQVLMTLFYNWKKEPPIPVLIYKY